LPAAVDPSLSVIHRPALWRRLVAEYVGSGLLAAVVIGSGIAAATLSPHALGLDLLENAAATGAGLYVLIVAFAPVSGAHFNPIVSLVDAVHRRLSWSDAALYCGTQILGCVSGAVLANLMFSHPAISLSTHVRATPAHDLSEVVATAGLIVVIFALARSGRSHLAPASVGSYIAAAYFFTSSTSFANPAIVVGRMFSNSFAGVSPSSAPAFIAAEVLGGCVGIALLRALFPDVASAEATATLASHTAPLAEEQA
jgi:glycerol uptake facilitator-like aquaporin